MMHQFLPENAYIFLVLIVILVAVGTLYAVFNRRFMMQRTEAKYRNLVENLALQDPLTKLPNRYMFTDFVADAIIQAQEQLDQFAVMSINLDRFKVINNTISHEVGDHLIQEICHRLQTCIGVHDILARPGSDEFLILLGRAGQEQATQVAQSILDVLDAPFDVDEREVYVTASLGISLFPRDASDASLLIKNADFAMLHVKRRGKNSYRFYTPKLSHESHDKLEMETGLRQALERGEFKLSYQPQVNLYTSKIIGCEALLRWEHPTEGLISPASFIPLAEETGLIIQIGEWVLRTACAQSKAWSTAGLPTMVMSVNLSARQFYQPGLVDKIAEILHDEGMDPQYLEVEITESITMDVARTTSILRALRDLGVRISIDDFGTGYSSLNYLKRFPIDKLKIDQSFVQDCIVDATDATIVATIIAMAHHMNLQVIAEGVETKEQLNFLQHHLCDEVQGYFLSKPVSPEKFVERYVEIEEIISKYGLSKDINERMRMEEAVRIAQQDLQDTVRKQQGMTLKFKWHEGNFIHTLCDGELLYKLGFVPEQVLGKALGEFLPADIAQYKATFYERAWQGEADVVYEGHINGIYYLASLRPLYRGGRVFEVIASCIDITERRKIEEALLQSEAKYRLIAENTSDLIWVLDTSGVIMYASPSCKSTLGQSSEALEGSSICDLVYAEDRSYFQTQFSQMVITKSPRRVELRHLRVDGKWVFLEATGVPVLEHEGNVEHIVAVARDITEHKKAEEVLRKADRLAVVGELAAGVAHEIRNPLTSIKGFIQLMYQGKGKASHFDIVASEMQRLEHIIDELLTLANPQPVQLKLHNIHNIVRDVSTLLETQALMYNVEIQQTIASNLPLLLCNDVQLKQVLINILKNAIESMPHGGKIDVHLQNQTPHDILIRIIDQGCGIPEDRLRRIGEPFYSNKEKGVGLGLLTSSKIIKEHNGTFQITSEVGVGTTVDVILPVRDAPLSLAEVDEVAASIRL